MKKSFYLFILLSFVTTSGVFGQRGALLLTFKATDYYSHDTLRMDSVHVENPAKNCDTTIYGDPAQLLLTWVTGIDEFTASNGFQVAQNYPNPYFGFTKCNIKLSGKKDMTLTLTDIYGKKLAVLEKTLQQGAHAFTIETGGSGIYFLTVSDGKASRTLKLNSMNTSSHKSFGISYAGIGNDRQGFKAAAQNRGFTFLPGDVLNFTPYLTGYESSTYSVAPTTDYTAYLVLKPNRLEITADTTSGYAPLLVHFGAGSNIPGIVSWHWDFGDGGTSDVPSPKHMYQIQDTSFTVSLTVTTDDNENVTTEKPDYITLLHDLASVNFSAYHTSGTAPLTVQFLGYTNIDPVIHWIWDFGDGETAQDIQNPTHTYDEGVYSVYLEVWGEEGSVWERKNQYIQVFDAICPSTVYDADGNVYNVVQIGEQCWMAENLNVGTMINKVSGSGGFQNDNGVIEKFCYDNDIEYCDAYGGLYQWDEAMQYSIEEGARGICPPGWHIPTDQEWIELEGYEEGNQGDNGWYSTGWRGTMIGLSLKQMYDGCWDYDGWGSEGDFTILAGGFVSEIVYPYFFKGECDDGYPTWTAFWTSTKKLGQEAWLRSFTSKFDLQYRNEKSWRGTRDRRNNAYSIRCIKNSDR